MRVHASVASAGRAAAVLRRRASAQRGLGVPRPRRHRGARRRSLALLLLAFLLEPRLLVETQRLHCVHAPTLELVRHRRPLGLRARVAAVAPALTIAAVPTALPGVGLLTVRLLLAVRVVGGLLAIRLLLAVGLLLERLLLRLSVRLLSVRRLLARLLAWLLARRRLLLLVKG